MADDLNGSPAARPLTVGDWIKSDDPRHGHRQARRVELITELPRWIGSTLIDTYAIAGKGDQQVRIKLRRIHLDGKPRRSGWRRVAAAAAATPEPPSAAIRRKAD